MQGRTHLIAFPVGSLLLALSLPALAQPTPAQLAQLAGEMEGQLRSAIQVWYPRIIDENYGGFLERFGHDWTHHPETSKTVVYQSRQTWTAAAVAAHDEDLRERYLQYAQHGLAALRDKLLDDEYGGFYWQVRADGSVDPANTNKHAYGISFVIYAAAAVYQLDEDPETLALAVNAYEFLENQARDRVNKGYYEFLSRTGRPIPPAADPNADPAADPIGTLIGYKSMNTHIHLLEAYTALYSVWPDPQLRLRLAELHELVRDVIAVPPGALNMFFTPDWRALPSHDSIGHDIETAFLLAESAAALGMPDDERTWQVARALVDHALRFGWDERYGGFYDKAEAFQPAYALEKIWWVQAEGLNALAGMHARFGHETDRYYQALVKQWDFIKRYQIDRDHGGWHNMVSRDGSLPAEQDKASQWKAAYHTSRALIHTSHILRTLAESQ